MNRDQFVAERRKGVGGSDVAAILGLDPRKTPYQVWREKLGLDPPAVGPALRRGQFMEPAILARYQRDVPGRACRPNVNIVRDGWRRGNLDMLVNVEDGFRVVEAKSVTREVFRREWGDPWTDQVPDRALAQGLWYQGLAEASVVHFAVAVIPDDPDLVLGCTAAEVMELSDFHVFEVGPKPDLHKQIVEHTSAFWHDFVVQQIAPPLMTIEDAELRWPTSTLGATKPGEPALELLRRYDTACEMEKQAKAVRGKLREKLMLYIEDAGALVAPDGRTPWLTCATSDRVAFVMPATTTRTLRFTKWWRKQMPDPNNQTAQTAPQSEKEQNRE